MGSKSNTSVTISRLRKNGLELRTAQERARTGYYGLSVADYLDRLLNEAGIPELSDQQYDVEIERHNKAVKAMEQQRLRHQEAA
jgi:hypothetical protein